MKGMTSKMHAKERASHDGKHDPKAKGDIGTVKRVIGGNVIVGPEGCGGRQGSKGLSGADPNAE